MRHNSHVVDSPGRTVDRSTLLETKLYAPQWRSGLVSRARLVERLQQVVERKLTLISAPAGFGKSTLLAEWLAQIPADGQNSAWVSLEQGDNDPTLFWAYFITALQRVIPGVGEGVLDLLHSHQAPPIEALLGTLLNEISSNSTSSPNGSGQNFVLVLDDYHVISSELIHGGVTFLIEHLPQQMHLVITGRSDPPLPLARLRGRGESTELRAPDLRFTPEEVSEFLRDVMNLELSGDHVAALESRTEGWIAGLQLAALSMQGRDDVSTFISAFTGDDRYVVDYLVEEVLQRQPARVRNFLLQTSVLDRLTGPLCDAVTGQEDGRQMLEGLERCNLFVVPLDGNRQWYRYHHLFREVLNSRLAEELPDDVAELHRRAGDWYGKNGLPSDVVRHALAGEDFERAATVMELEAMAMISRCEEPTLLEWLNTLPEEVVRNRPVLSVYYAFVALTYVGLDEAEGMLRDAERLMDSPTDEMVVVDENAFRSLPGSISVARAYHAGARGNWPETLIHAQQALEQLPDTEHFWRGAGTAFLGISYWANGDLESAHASFASGINTLRLAGDAGLEVSGDYVLAGIRMAQGRLREAERIFNQSIQVASNLDNPGVLGSADLYVGLAELNCEYGDVEAAERNLKSGEAQGEFAEIPENRYRSSIVRARIKEIAGDLEGSLDNLEEAERLFIKNPTPDVRPIAAIRARVWIALGRLTEARDWLYGQGLSTDDEASYLREYEHITLAKLHTAQFRLDGVNGGVEAAIGLLDRLLEAAEVHERNGSILSILITQALAHEALDDVPAGLKSLERALKLAEPEGYCRIFVDEGEPMRNLLRHAAGEGLVSAYTHRLLAEFDKASQVGTSGRVAAIDGLVEPLSDREIEILRLIAAGMTNKEIAEQLVVSMSTIKTHINRTYRKLDVHSRTQALVKIRELDLA